VVPNKGTNADKGAMSWYHGIFMHFKPVRAAAKYLHS